MKILTLSFKNIHSLKGEHKIDFTIPPLSNAGLFAITGPTGAGKSTILDLITLALFSRMPRFNEKITNTEIEKIGSVMTHFTDDAYAEIEYQSNGKTYRSTWSISKTKKGNLKPYEMSLAELPEGKFLDLKNSEVPANNEKIIGLNYEQFIRSILLSQGEFAKFLKSDEKERAKLLEDITGSQIYRTLGKAAFEKAKQKKEEIQTLKQQINFVPLLEKDQITEKKNMLIAYNTSIKNINVALTEKINLSALLEKTLIIRQKIDLTIKNKSAHEEKQNQFKPLALKLDKHQRLDIYRGDLSLLNNEYLRIESTEKEISRLDLSIKEQEHILFKALKDMAVFTHQEINESNFMSEMTKFQQIIVGYDHVLSKAKEDGIQLRNKINLTIHKSNNALITNLKNINTTPEQLAYVEKKLKNLDPKKAKSNLSDQELNTETEQLQQDIIRLNQQKTDLQRRDETVEEIHGIHSEINTLKESESALKAQCSELLIDIEQLSAEINELQHQKESQLKIATMEEHRQQLQQGEACPLCGSIEHPFLQQDHVFNIGKVTIALHLKLDKIENIKTSFASIQNKIAGNEARTKTLLQQVYLKQSGISKINELWHDPDGKLSFKLISEDLEKAKLNLVNLQEAKEIRFLINLFDELKVAFQELILTGQKYSETAAIRTKLYNGNNVHRDADNIQNAFIAANGIMKELTVTYKNLLMTRGELINSIEKRKLVLLPNLEKLGYKSISEASRDILVDDVLQNIIIEKDTLTRSETELVTTLQNLQKELSDLDEVNEADNNLDLIKNDIQQLNKEKDQLNNNIGAIEKELEKDFELVTLIAEAKNTLEIKEKEASTWFIMDHLIGDATGNKYAKYAQNLSLKHLIMLTNKRLSKLSDRYLMMTTSIEDDLSVIDLYQGNITRSVKTLSGGESFIVSLALALSLSDMASKNVKLESLFIDEGFGTLDAETLEIALATLEKLQSESSRIIGIISHVDSLKERITTQIQVEKNNLGYASICIAG